jgi:serine/threonine protein phosphatase PrpC
VCYVVNLGDTRAVLIENGKAERKSVDHKGTN